MVVCLHSASHGTTTHFTALANVDTISLGAILECVAKHGASMCDEDFDFANRVWSESLRNATQLTSLVQEAVSTTTREALFVNHLVAL